MTVGSQQRTTPFQLYRRDKSGRTGQDGEEYSRRTITEILRKSVEKTGIKKHVTVHTLRHSFATHLLEAGTDIRYIQSLLGHENTKTTEIYTHITTRGFDQIKSPLDRLKIN
jgi:site-specific recombinase XerD